MAETFILVITFQIYFSSSYSYIFYYKHPPLTGDVFGFFLIILGIQNIYDKKQIKVDFSVPHLYSKKYIVFIILYS